MNAAGFAAAGAVLTFFGFMHAPAVGVMMAPGVALAYALLAGLLLAVGRQPAAVMAPAVAE
jgi:AGZA family xanthine/uracil permease-like MFS transporter